MFGEEEIIEQKCVFWFSLRIFLKHSSLKGEFSEMLSYVYKLLHVKYLLFLSGCNETWIFCTGIRKIFQCRLSFQWEPRCFMRTDRHDEANRCFSQFFESAQKCVSCEEVAENVNGSRLVPRGSLGIALAVFCLSVFGAKLPQWARASSFTRFLDHTQQRTTVGRTPLDEWSARRRDLYLATYNIHNGQTSMPTVRFEPTIAASERPQTYALDRAATGTGVLVVWLAVNQD